MTQGSTDTTSGNVQLKDKSGGFVGRLLLFLRQGEFALLLVIVALVAGVSLLSENFLTTTNLLNALLAIVTIGITALGVAFVLICKEIDLSVASMIGLVGVVAAWLMQNGVPPWLALLLGLSLGLVGGLLNGLIVVYCGVNSFIVTLGTLSVFQGITLLITSGLPISMPESTHFIGRATIGPVPLQVIIMLALVVITQLVLSSTVFGRRVQIVGDNQEAARLAGIPVAQTKILVFVVAGGLAGVAGIIRASALGTAEPGAGQADLLPIIAAVFVGGVTLMGGRGSMVGVFLGAVLLGLVANAYVILRLSSFLQLATFGAVIVLAGVFDQARQGRFSGLSQRLRSTLSRSKSTTRRQDESEGEQG